MSFKIIRNDITKVTADAIVNTANPEPLFAPGTDSAIYMAAGADAMLKERKKIGKIEVGEAAFTSAFALNARYVIHTVGPVWTDGSHGEKEAIRNCYKNSLDLAKELGCESIAFPLISTGVYGFPKADALQTAVSVFSEFLSVSDMEIILVVFDNDSFELSGKIFAGIDEYIDDNYVEERLDEEYGHPAGVPGISAAADDNVPKRRRRGLFLLGAARESEPDPVCYNASMPPDAAEESILNEDNECFEVCENILAAEARPLEKRSLDEVVAQLSQTWQESLFRLIDEKGYTDTEVYKRANVDRKLFSKIRSNAAYQPKKITAVAFALALKLDIDETKDFLGRAGYAFSPSSKFDLIIEYFIEQEVYDTYTINLALFAHDQPLIGD
ncbi:MAG: macro domain-containing protein [Lachnospiraceae bacterium]|nr:macro domain-containing protein [Lachnospiraceae bacterium]